MKRKAEDSGVFMATRSKRPLLYTEYTPPERKQFWVSGTDTKNYMINDPLVDWLKVTRKKTERYNNFSDFIMRKGQEFEKQITQYIHNHKLEIVYVSDKITDESCEKTIDLMKNGIPIIYSAPFKNKTKHIKGIIDLLVRSDFLHIFTGQNPLPENLQSFPAVNLNKNYHYIVIDVKFSTLPLKSDGIHILNSGMYPAYKSQLWIYTQGIGEIQGYVSDYAFILGRRYRYTSKGEIFNSLNCLDRLGTINYGSIDSEYKNKTLEAINWLKEVRKNGKRWTLDPPSRPELYPNMCVNSGIWNKAKEEIAEKIGDITQIWHCGVKNREKALKNGIKSWRDPRCSSKTIGVNGTRAGTIDKIIAINRQDKDKILPQKISTNMYNWRKHSNEIFVDFETFTDIFADFRDLPSQPKTDMIFMIGVWYKEKEEWTYKNFVANKATNEEEFNIMDNFIKFVKKRKVSRIWYWHAEPSIWEKAENRQIDISQHCNYIVKHWQIRNWCDLCQIFRQEPIVVKGCFKFGLKQVSKAMRENGLIKTHIESSCHSGMDAAVVAWQTYQTSENPANDPKIVDIAKYNEFDVKVLWEILMYLREKH